MKSSRPSHYVVELELEGRTAVRYDLAWSQVVDAAHDLAAEVDPITEGRALDTDLAMWQIFDRCATDDDSPPVLATPSTPSITFLRCGAKLTVKAVTAESLTAPSPAEPPVRTGSPAFLRPPRKPSVSIVVQASGRRSAHYDVAWPDIPAVALDLVRQFEPTANRRASDVNAAISKAVAGGPLASYSDHRTADLGAGITLHLCSTSEAKKGLPK